jgi:hypothetical protein
MPTQPNVLTAEQAVHVLGGEGSLWGKYVSDVRSRAARRHSSLDTKQSASTSEYQIQRADGGGQVLEDRTRAATNIFVPDAVIHNMTDAVKRRCRREAIQRRSICVLSATPMKTSAALHA